jgi:hypothetical protein
MSGDNYNNHLKIGELPHLKVVEISSLIFHEDPDRERLLGLVERLANDSFLINPPIVARVKGNSRRIILDGANRVTALMKLGFRHVVIQTVNFEDDLLAMNCWHHAVEKLDRSYFLIKLNQIPDVRVIEREPFETIGEERQMLADEKNYLCRIIFRDKSVVALKGGDDILTQTKQLKEITSIYLNTPYSDRVSYINLEFLTKHYPEFQALMTFRHIGKDAFMKIIDANMKLPAGVSRIFLPKRALGLNIHLEFLKSDLTLEEKNRWLEDMILKRVREKAIRFYREPTFRFDE